MLRCTAEVIGCFGIASIWDGFYLGKINGRMTTEMLTMVEAVKSTQALTFEFSLLLCVRPHTSMTKKVKEKTKSADKRSTG
jgi:hypothetical protein